jgi:hypothetical protein
MSKEKTPPSAYAILKAKHFPDLDFEKKHKMMAGRMFKNGASEQEVVQYLQGKGSESLMDVKPPAKSPILAQSRPFDEWEMVRTSRLIQETIFGIPKRGSIPKRDGLSETQFNELVASLEVGGKPMLNKQTRAIFYGLLGIKPPTFHAMAQNILIDLAINIRKGVLKKVDNLNEKNRKKVKRIRDAGEQDVMVPAEVTAHDDRGYLNHPPGVNPTIPGYQGVVIPFPEGFEGLPSGMTPVDWSHVLVDYLPHDRLSIPKGSPGYIPEWQRPLLNRHKGRRHRSWYANSLNKPRKSRTEEAKDRQNAGKRTALIEAERLKGVLPVLMRFKEDWLIIDARGLLRNARYRGVLPEGSTLGNLIDLFSDSPRVDTRRGICTFLYRKGRAYSTKPVKRKESKETLLKLTEKSTIALVSIDLGQTNPLTAKLSKVRQVDGCLVAEPVLRKLIDNASEDGKEIARYRVAHDLLRARILEDAIDLLGIYKDEVVRARSDTPDLCKERVCRFLGLDSQAIDWDRMTPYTDFIAQAFVAKGGDPKVVTIKPNGKPKMFRKDRSIKNMKGIRLDISKEASSAYREAQWAIQRESPDFQRLAVWQSQLTKRIVNQLVAWAKKCTQCDTVVLAFEDLNIGMMHGSGKWANGGWNALFLHKQENRWFMQAFHKALTELSAHKGIPTIEVLPHRTSITCTQCGHCHPGNRDGERFKCLKCEFLANTDLEIATDNIERVALTGLPMPKGERSSAKRKPGGTRKTKKSKHSGNSPLAAE